MANDEIDEFSIENPNNFSAGRWNRLLRLRRKDPTFSQVESRFLKHWKHPEKPKPYVHAILKVLSPEGTLQPYLRYRASVQASPSVNSSKGPGNERFLFHGTNRLCNLGEDIDDVRLCSLPECSLCMILRTSFDVSKCGTKHKFRRFGSGIYVTSCSSKADDYCLNGNKALPLRVLLLNRVVVGKPHKRRTNATHLTEPPPGYHSVIGEVGADLNYKETVVYNNDAIRPAYLIVYGEPKEVPISKVSALVVRLFKTPLAS